MFNASLVQESIRRARPLGLEALIQKMDKEPAKTNATPAQANLRRQALYEQIDDPLVAKVRLERILQGNDLTDISYLTRGIECSRAICRIAIRDDRRLLGYGTGFMVAPGILLTNHHVISSEELASHSVAQFGYERDSSGKELKEVEFRLKPAPKPILLKELDMALVAVEPRSIDGSGTLASFGWLKLSPQSGKAFVGEYLTIIQHPNGERKQVCIRENRLLRYSGNGPYLWYQTDTVGGSSGSPVFNNAWEVVALHHSGVPETRRIGGRDVWIAKDGKPWTEAKGEDEIHWIANEGVRVSRIVSYLQTQQIGNPIAIQVLGAEPVRQDEATSFGASHENGGLQIQTTSAGRTRILVPIEIDCHVGFSAAAAEREVRPARNSVVPFIPTVVEAVYINQENYDKRSGYGPDFLGSGFEVPLPKVVNKKFGTPLVVGDKNSSELRYWNYSVVMNESRALAYFSAANIHTGKFRGSRADGDTWYLDTRVTKVSDKAQIGKEFYKKQKTFESMDRTMNPFDQGHLSRRSDLQWGDDDETAKLSGDDSFHYTNCAPQHWQFNQNNAASGLWYHLEDTAIAQNPGGKVTVINGPVFDAPLSVRGDDGWMRLNLKGKRVPDGTFGDFKIPKQFFKVIVYRSENQLKARAFVVTQEDLLTTIDRYYPEAMLRETTNLTPFNDMEVRLYQVTIPQLEKLTSLDFGPLRDHDTKGTEEAALIGQGLPLQSLSQVIF